MVNIDGVLCGNSRCTLAGVDPNRVWHFPNPILHPVVSADPLATPLYFSGRSVYKSLQQAGRALVYKFFKAMRFFVFLPLSSRIHFLLLRAQQLCVQLSARKSEAFAPLALPKHNSGQPRSRRTEARTSRELEKDPP